MQYIIIVTLVLYVSQGHCETRESGHVYNLKRCNGFAQELSMEGDLDLTEYINPDLGGWSSVNFTGG